MPSFSSGREPENYLCHAWLPDDRVIVGTDSGNLLLLESGSMVCVLASSPSGGQSVFALAAFSKGFVCAGVDGCVRVYTRSDDEGHDGAPYRLLKTFRVIGQRAPVTNLSVSPSEDYLGLTTANHQMFVLPMVNFDVLKEGEMNFELVSASFHGPASWGGGAGGEGALGGLSLGGGAAGAGGEAKSGAGASAFGGGGGGRRDQATGAHITGLDVCLRKPLVATCGLDRSVRVWNYLDKSTDQCKVRGEREGGRREEDKKRTGVTRN